MEFDDHPTLNCLFGRLSWYSLVQKGIRDGNVCFFAEDGIVTFLNRRRSINLLTGHDLQTSGSSPVLDKKGVISRDFGSGGP